MICPSGGAAARMRIGEENQAALLLRGRAQWRARIGGAAALWSSAAAGEEGQPLMRG